MVNECGTGWLSVHGKRCSGECTQKGACELPINSLFSFRRSFRGWLPRSGGPMWHSTLLGGGSQPLPQEILGNVKAWEYSWATQPHLAQAQGVALGVPARVSAGRCAPPAPLCPSFSESPFRRLL